MLMRLCEDYNTTSTFSFQFNRPVFVDTTPYCARYTVEELYGDSWCKVFTGRIPFLPPNQQFQIAAAMIRITIGGLVICQHSQ